MLLSGSLEAFRVQDLLGLVGRKPGQWLISVTSGPRRAHIALREGAVVSVSADEGRQDLARRLVVEGAIGTTGLSEALRHANDSGLGLVRALVDSHKVEPSEVEPMVRAHIVSALAALTHWRSGAFSADRVQDLPDDLGRGFPLADIGPQISQLLHRWRPASDALGGSKTVMAVYPGPVPAHLTGLHSLIDGHRTVIDLVEASGHGEIGTVVDLADLVEAGCAAPLTGKVGAVEQRLAMLSALEHASPQQPEPHPRLTVIEGEGAGVSVQAQPPEQDLLKALIKGVRGV